MMIGTQPVGAIDGVVISAVSHEGLVVTVHGKPAKLAIVTDDGHVIAAGDDVAREAEAVAINSYRSLLQGQGFLRVRSKPIVLHEGIEHEQRIDADWDDRETSAGTP